jgi:FMN phosphatase YigB (HAD superfamily)
MIRNVVFDIGGVLVRLRYQPFIDYLASAGIDMTDLPAWLERVDLAAHERGEITGEELLGRVAAMAARPLDPGELRGRWLDMFDRAQEMFELASGLMGEYRVFLLSNIGDMHWRHLDALYGLEALTHGVLASFRVGAVKPSAAIYREAERRFELEPAATVLHGSGTPGLSYRPGGRPSEQRLYYLVRNRWIVIGKCYATRTLVLLAPALLFYELMQLTWLLRQGQGRVWWRALREITRQRRSIF